MAAMTFCSLLILVAVGFVLPTTRGSLVLNINENFHHDDGLDPCISHPNPIKIGYCDCQPSDEEEIKDVNCYFHQNPSKKEWRAISKLRTVTSIQFWNRPIGTIREIPPSFVFSEMKKLQYFTMKVTAVDAIPSFAFGNSSGVAEIYLQGNNVFELAPFSFANMVNATLINLSENNLTEINRDVFVNLPSLTDLVLMKNGIVIIHDYAFKDLNNLEQLALQYNNLRVITREVFAGLGRLTRLELQENNIEFIGDHVFAEMPLLVDLDLNKNKISLVSPAAFAGLKHLSRLNLKDNKLVSFRPETFTHLSKILFLDLQGNQLETLEYSLMKPIYTNLKNMSMQFLVKDNRFMCDCRILWMKRLYEETESDYVRRHINGTTCNLFESNGKHAGQSSASSSSPTFFHRDGVNEDMLTGPPEETTTYSLESVVPILNLTEKDFNCGEEVNLKHHDNMPHHDTAYSYHHQVNENGHHKHQSNLDKSGNSHYGDFQIGDVSSEGMTSGGNHNSILNEPQATAALEGTDITGRAPKNTASADHKIDNSRITQTLPSSSVSKYRICDFSVLLLSVILGARATTLVLI